MSYSRILSFEPTMKLLTVTPLPCLFHVLISSSSSPSPPSSPPLLLPCPPIQNWGPEVLDLLEHFLVNPEVVAVGETGLDYNRMLSTKDEQRDAFAAQVESAIPCLFLFSWGLHTPSLLLLSLPSLSSCLHFPVSLSILPPFLFHSLTLSFLSPSSLHSHHMFVPPTLPPPFSLMMQEVLHACMISYIISTAATHPL